MPAAPANAFCGIVSAIAHRGASPRKQPVGELEHLILKTKMAGEAQRTLSNAGLREGKESSGRGSYVEAVVWHGKFARIRGKRSDALFAEVL
jgi:hypothetical protein